MNKTKLPEAGEVVVLDFPGVTGKLTLDANRDATKSAVILTVKDGKFKYVETVAP